MDAGEILFQLSRERLSVQLKVIPKAERNRIVGFRGQELWVRIVGPARDGKANQELVKFLAKTLALPRSAVQIVRGERSRHKRIELPAAAAPLLRHYLSMALTTQVAPWKKDTG